MRETELISKAKTRYLRVSARKVRVVIDLIRGEKVPTALVILANINKRAKICVEKSLRSALSNAGSRPEILTESLFISKIIADNGPMLKRYRAAAMGRATTIRHRTTHLTIELARSKVGQVKRGTRKPVTSRSTALNRGAERGRSAKTLTKKKKKVAR